MPYTIDPIIGIAPEETVLILTRFYIDHVNSINGSQLIKIAGTIHRYSEILLCVYREKRSEKDCGSFL